MAMDEVSEANLDGLRDYAMLDGERLESLWNALDRVTRERDEAHAALEVKGEYGYSQHVVDALTKERDALRAEVGRLRSVIPSLIVVQRMPNAEHVADAHNDAVRVLRAAL